MNGAMIALPIAQDVAQAIAAPGGEAPDRLHVTLVFLGEASDLTLGQVKAVHEVVEAIARAHPPLSVRLSGLGRFAASQGSDDKEVIYASVDAPGLAALRTSLVQALEANGVPYRKDHDFVPHLTLVYVPPATPGPAISLPDEPFTVGAIAVHIGDEVMAHPLSGAITRSLDTRSETRSTVGRPFGEYKDMAACLLANQDKDDPAGYCATLHKKVTGEWPGEVKRMDEHEPAIERYHDAFVEALRQALREHVDDETFSAAIRYARARAGGYASGESKRKKREEDESSAIAKLVVGEPLAALSVEELAVVASKLPV